MAYRRNMNLDTTTMLLSLVAVGGVVALLLKKKSPSAPTPADTAKNASEKLAKVDAAVTADSCAPTTRQAMVDARVSLFGEALQHTAPKTRSWELEVLFTWYSTGTYKWKATYYAGLDPSEVEQAVVKAISLIDAAGKKTNSTFAICAGGGEIKKVAKSKLVVSG